MFVHENRSEPPQGQVFPTTAPRCRRPSSKLNPPSPAREAATPTLSSGSLLVLSLLTNSEFHRQTPARSHCRNVSRFPSQMTYVTSGLGQHHLCQGLLPEAHHLPPRASGPLPRWPACCRCLSGQPGWATAPSAACTWALMIVCWHRGRCLYAQDLHDTCF